MPVFSVQIVALDQTGHLRPFSARCRRGLAKKKTISCIPHMQFHDETMHAPSFRRKLGQRDLADHILLKQKTKSINLRTRRNRSVPDRDAHSLKAC